ncbi:MAG: hypothetical protein BYD32DRAFT_425276 [Podila humilis]|nr:MAG: hypothetical protein BYD32DRAFT_425276 [Podila humilis]
MKTLKPPFFFFLFFTFSFSPPILSHPSTAPFCRYCSNILEQKSNKAPSASCPRSPFPTEVVSHPYPQFIPSIKKEREKVVVTGSL